VSIYRMAVPGSGMLSGLNLYAAPMPCDMPLTSGDVGCCPTPMPSSFTFSLLSPTGSTTTYTVVWGAWYGAGYYFWQYTASGTVADNVVSKIDFYCLGSDGYYPYFGANVYFGGTASSPTTFFTFGPVTAVCCGAGISSDFLWSATHSTLSSGAPTSGPPTSGAE
jgi:hypothetical protein